MTDLASLKERLGAYLTAEAAILKSQSYTIGDGSTARTLTRANLSEVRQAIKDLQHQIDTHPQNQARARRRMVYLRPY